MLRLWTEKLVSCVSFLVLFFGSAVAMACPVHLLAKKMLEEIHYKQFFDHPELDRWDLHHPRWNQKITFEAKENDGWKESEVRAMYHPILTSNLLVEQVLKIPETLRVELSRQSDVAVHDRFNNVSWIRVPYQFVEYLHRRYTKHPKYSLPIVAHEYGHALFADHFLKGEDKTSSYLIDCYQELFSDVLAVYFARDRHAVYKALHFFVAYRSLSFKGYPKLSSSRKRYQRYHRYRSFQENVKLQAWKDTQEPMLRYPSEHIALAPTRSFLGKYVMFQPQYTDEQVVAAVLRAIGSEMEGYFSGLDLIDVSTCPKSMQDMNARLISAIERELGR